MNPEFILRSSFYVFAALAAVLFAEFIYLAVIAPMRRQTSINRRLKSQEAGLEGEQALMNLKAERGLLGRNLEVMNWLTRLLVQSGLRVTTRRYVVMSAFGLAAVFLGLALLTPLSNLICFVIAFAVAVLFPLQIVRLIRSRRKDTFASQLPEALDVIVRSLRSGHPVATAMGMVSREMNDPIGTEFGMTIDEMTYGLDMPKALQNLADRVGVPDLSLLVTAVSLQVTSGGNLSDVLDNLSKVLRDRFQLRRKVRSISAEGRFSAYGLTILPILIFLAIFLQHPPYYTDVWGEPLFKMAIGGLVIWSLIGDYIMYKMINFKF